MEEGIPRPNCRYYEMFPFTFSRSLPNDTIIVSQRRYCEARRGDLRTYMWNGLPSPHHIKERGGRGRTRFYLFTQRSNKQQQGHNKQQQWCFCNGRGGPNGQSGNECECEAVCLTPIACLDASDATIRKCCRRNGHWRRRRRRRRLRRRRRRRRRYQQRSFSRFFYTGVI